MLSTNAGAVDSIRWQMTSPSGGWSDVAGATGLSELVDLANGRHDDGAMIRVGLTSTGVEVFSDAAPLAYAPPIVLVPNDDLSFVLASGRHQVDATVYFDGVNLTFETDEMQGVSVDPSTGLISFDTDQFALQADTSLLVTARNSGGFANMTLNLTIVAATAFTLTAIDSEPVIADADGALSIQIESGVFAGTYNSRVTDGVSLTTDMVETAATPLVLPAINGVTDIGSTLTCVAGLWLYAGTKPDAPSYQWFRDDLPIAGATGSMHVIGAADQDTVLTVRESFGEVTIESGPVSVPPGAAFTPSDLASYRDDFDAGALGAFNLVGQKIGAWENQGPGSNRFSMANDAARPKVLTSAQNAMDVVRFDQGDYFQDVDSPDFGDTGTLMIVFRAITVSSPFSSLFAHTGGARSFQIDSGDTTGGEFFGRVNSTAHRVLINPVSTQNDWTIFAYRFDSMSGVASLWVDGAKVDETLDYSTYGTPTRLSVAASRNLSATLNHDAAQLWRFDDALTDTELLQLFTYAQTRWGIS
ncbi:hypothetical protein [Cognatiyoonia koreensis]|nr:hypothetical protein [Cognatiyoonia koreensis]